MVPEKKLGATSLRLKLYLTAEEIEKAKSGFGKTVARMVQYTLDKI